MRKHLLIENIISNIIFEVKKPSNVIIDNELFSSNLKFIYNNDIRSYIFTSYKNKNIYLQDLIYYTMEDLIELYKEIVYIKADIIDEVILKCRVKSIVKQKWIRKELLIIISMGIIL